MRRAAAWLAVAAASYALTDLAAERFAAAVAESRRPRATVCSGRCAHGFVPASFTYPEPAA